MDKTRRGMFLRHRIHHRCQDNHLRYMFISSDIKLKYLIPLKDAAMYVKSVSFHCLPLNNKLCEKELVLLL